MRTMKTTGTAFRRDALAAAIKMRIGRFLHQGVKRQKWIWNHKCYLRCDKKIAPVLFHSCVVQYRGYPVAYFVKYHFSTSLKCYLSSCIMCPVVLAVVRYVPYSMTVWGLLTLTALIILSILSPVEAANKPLDEKEQRIFGITARILIIISAVCWSVTAIVFRQLILSKIISLSIISVAVFVIAGKMYLTVRKHN